ncbi:MAG: type II toxin-antitoxin system VapC family toxin [Candidatus Kerfeldbacteria bacterium]|nr:type II toxin-antitoxin system VapC family toxin [Candidatus Kerfeldbacteria bacterium]
MGALIDTTVVIDLANGDQAAVDFCNTLLQQSGLIYISTITAMEVFVGAQRKRELNYLTELISIFRPIKMTEEISDIALGLMKKYRLAHGLSIPDALIAATGLVENLVLYTHNLKHFRHIAQLDVQRPY